LALRAFIAIDIPDGVRKAVHTKAVELRRRMADDAVRWVRPEGYHLTLKFLGEIETAQVPLIEAAMGSAADGIGRFSLRLGSLGVFPNQRRPRVLWVAVEGGADSLGRLQSRLEQALGPIGFKTEGRSFHPHLTLARIKRPLEPGALSTLQSALQKENLAGTPAFGVDSVKLIRSELRPTGAVYTTLHITTLV